jgi:hypothetical protein
MINITISVNYVAKWRIKGFNNYIVTECGKVINTERGKVIKRVVKGYSIGYNIAGKFVTLTELKKQLVKIDEVYCPF